MADDESVLARWGRRKAAARQPVDAVEPNETEVAAVAPTAIPADTDAGATQDPEKATPEEIAALPDIDSLDESSDFSAFMKEGVPEELKTRALRKLWRLDPAFAHVDGLLDYDEDFTDAALVVEGLKTAYKVGKGMMSDEEETEEDSVAEGEPDTPEDDRAALSTDEPEIDTADVTSTATLTNESQDTRARDTTIESPKETTPTGKP